jgi:hypothetical protein
MWGALARLFSRKSSTLSANEALAAPIATIRRTPDAEPDAAALVFIPAENCRHDPVFLSRVQWRLQELLYDGGTPINAEETTVRDRVRTMGIASESPRVYHLSNEFAPPVPLYVADVAISRRLYSASLDFGDHNSLLRVRYDLSGAHPSAELVGEPTNPTAMARRRLEALLDRGARFIWVELVQANYRLYAHGPDSAACMVMFSFDESVSTEELRSWSERLHPFKHTHPPDPVLRQAVSPLEASDRAWYYHRRFTMPLAFTGGREVFLADLWAHRPFIKGRFRHRAEYRGKPRQLACLVEKKETGWAGIELIPYNEVELYTRRATVR